MVGLKQVILKLNSQKLDYIGTIGTYMYLKKYGFDQLMKHLSHLLAVDCRRLLQEKLMIFLKKIM